MQMTMIIWGGIVIIKLPWEAKPIIESISLGVNRITLFKNKKSKDIYKFNLDNGSLLVMQGNTQKEWVRSIPKRKNILGSRINLTFRTIKDY